MRFSRIRLENWRNFATVDVPLENRAFIVGANASGKSNLLDVFKFLHDLVVPGGGFQAAVTRRGGVSSIRNIAARNQPGITIDIELVNDDTTWRYRIAFDRKNRNNNTPILVEEKIWKNDRVIVNRPNEDDKTDEARLAQTLLEQTFANKEFRDISDFFQTITYTHLVPQLVREPERYIQDRQIDDPYGGDFLEQIATKNTRSQNAYLNRIENALKIAVPQLSELQFERDKKTGTPHLKARYNHWRPKGQWQNETDFSDGTLRLIGLLWTVQDSNGPLLLEEPELSLHPGIVRHIPQMLLRIQRDRGRTYRQIFMSTHSEVLLSDEGIGADELLLLRADPTGTRVEVGSQRMEIVQALQAELSPADIVIPFTQPANLSLLGRNGN